MFADSTRTVSEVGTLRGSPIFGFPMRNRTRSKSLCAGVFFFSIPFVFSFFLMATVVKYLVKFFVVKKRRNKVEPVGDSVRLRLRFNQFPTFWRWDPSHTSSMNCEPACALFCRIFAHRSENTQQFFTIDLINSPLAPKAMAFADCGLLRLFIGANGAETDRNR